MPLMRHRIIVDLTAEEMNSMEVQEQLSRFGEVHTVSVKKMTNEHGCVKLLAMGLGKQELEEKCSHLAEIMSTLHNSDLITELELLTSQLGSRNSS